MFYGIINFWRKQNDYFKYNIPCLMNMGESHTLKKNAEKEMEPKEEIDKMKEYIEYLL